MSVRITGGDRLKGMHARLGKALVTATRESGLLVLSETKRRAHATVITGTTYRSYQMRLVSGPGTRTAFIGSNMAGAAVKEKGRRPGAKPPPPRALLPFVRKRWGLRGDAAERAAYRLSRSIGRKGIRPKPVLKAALQKRRQRIGQIFLKHVRAAMR